METKITSLEETREERLQRINNLTDTLKIDKRFLDQLSNEDMSRITNIIIETRNKIGSIIGGSSED